MAGKLSGKVAVITGAGSGMGAAMVELFCREGARVIAADISGEQNRVAAGVDGECRPFQVDVSESTQVQEMLRTAVSTYGRLDILCNNAAIGGMYAKIAEHREEDFDRVWAVNGRSVFLGMKYAIPLMLANGGGSIVNTASMAAHVVFPSHAAYNAAKAAVIMLTKTAAAEYGAEGIRVNAVLPGAIRTGMTKILPEEYLTAVVKATPLGRIGEPVEMANLALFLASDESSFITGAEMLVDGGYTTL